jgi:TetR/AcrR family transcriptional repressor of nem operon
MPIQKISREEILSKSMEVFRRKGYYHATMNDLANACGLFKGSLYHYFPSKEALMEELLNNTLGYLTQKVFSIAYETTSTTRERMERMLGKLSRVLLASDGSCFIGNTTLETAQHIPVFQQILRSIFDAWIIALQHLFATHYSPEEALRLARRSVMEFEGAVMLSYLYQDQSFLLEVKDNVLAKLPV